MELHRTEVALRIWTTMMTTEIRTVKTTISTIDPDRTETNQEVKILDHRQGWDQSLSLDSGTKDRLVVRIKINRDLDQNKSSPERYQRTVQQKDNEDSLVNSVKIATVFKTHPMIALAKKIRHVFTT